MPSVPLIRSSSHLTSSSALWNILKLAKTHSALVLTVSFVNAAWRRSVLETFWSVQYIKRWWLWTPWLRCLICPPWENFQNFTLCCLKSFRDYEKRLHSVCGFISDVEKDFTIVSLQLWSGWLRSVRPSVFVLELQRNFVYFNREGENCSSLHQKQNHTWMYCISLFKMTQQGVNLHLG